ncbi:MAG: hypothetical protein APR62_03975 [Smithella sp. SDB]|nr:MAG: hypothetical protein APR62_03975 [Smithella sp. SDB]
MQNTLPQDKTGSRFSRLLIKIGSSSPLEPYERRKRLSAVFILLTIMFATFLFSIYHFLKGHFVIFAWDCVGFFASLFILLYLRKKETSEVVDWMLGMGLVTFCSVTTIIGRTEISIFLWAFMLPIACFSVMGSKKGMAVTIIFFFINLLLMIAPEQIMHSKPYSSFIVIRFSIVYIILTFIIYYYESSQQMLISYIQHEKEEFAIASKQDPLTGLYNRREMWTRMESERERQLRLSKPFTVIIGDIDDFKNVNDTYGHDGGDYVLITIARLMKDMVRGIDFTSRWGGEEFLIMLVETDLNDGKNVAERIRKKIEDTEFKYKNVNIPITMTFGLSVYKEASDNIEACIKRADQALYKGKYQGKNRVVAS